jgi:lysophospholipase L1-like esterase
MIPRRARTALCAAAGLLLGCLAASPALAAGTVLASAVTLPYDNAGTSDDASPAAANLDGSGSSLSAQALADAGWSPGATYTLDDGARVTVPAAAPGQPDNTVAAGQQVAVSGSGAALDFVVTSTHGATSGGGTISYSDGSSQAYTIGAPDWYTGTTGVAVVSAWRNTPSGAQYHQVNLYRAGVALAAGKTVTGVTLPDVGGSGAAPELHVFALAFAPAAPGLAAFFDNTGVSDDSATTGANLDGSGQSMSATDLTNAGWAPGTTVTAGGAPLAWPAVPAGRPDNVVAAGQTVPASGSGRALTFLVTGTDGDASGGGTITYTDGSTASYQLTAPDWYTGPTDTATVLLPHWNTPTGTVSAQIKLYAESVPLDPAKSLRSVTLPNPGGGAALHVFALAVRPTAPGWAGSWAAASDDGLVNGPWTNRTLRMVEHTSTGGSQVRVRLDNDFATAAATVGHVTVAVQSSAAAATGTPVSVTFAGNRQVTLPAGGQAVSDPVGFAVPADSNLLVSLYLPGTVALAPLHSLGLQDMYSTADGAGDQDADVGNYPVNNTFGFWTLLSGVDVLPASTSGTVVAFGDSITDGVGSTYNGNDRWPNDLARRLLAAGGSVPGVVDEGISANKVTLDDFTGVAGSGNGGIKALARLDRDLLAQTQVRTVVVLEGINDVNSDVPAATITAGLAQIAAQAHLYGVRIIAATLTPEGGCSCSTAAREQVREAVNAYIRGAGSPFDGWVDFDAAVRDPANPTAMLATYDSGDHLHPSAAGYHAMANAIDLSQL